jgi:hypothetical protein
VDTVSKKTAAKNYFGRLWMTVKLVTCKVLKQLTCKYGISCHNGGYRGTEPLLLQQLVRYVLIALHFNKKWDLSMS